LPRLAGTYDTYIVSEVSEFPRQRENLASRSTELSSQRRYGDDNPH
jgi:hypothetical protein